MKREQQPDAYVKDCACGRCPRYPRGRPPTKAETWAVVHHQYEGFWSQERMVQEAIDRFCWAYSSWVNNHGWRKPPDWDGQRHVNRYELRPAGVGMFPGEVRDWAQRLRKEAEARASAA